MSFSLAHRFLWSGQLSSDRKYTSNVELFLESLELMMVFGKMSKFCRVKYRKKCFQGLLRPKKAASESGVKNTLQRRSGGQGMGRDRREIKIRKPKSFGPKE